jgi:gamma-glutamyl-gamma-aminobutyrate hydrolase PuuD
MQSKKFNKYIFLFFILLFNISTQVKIDVNPLENSVKIQLDQPTPFLLTRPKIREIKPVISIGILSLDVSPTTEKILNRKYTSKEYNDFMFSDIAPTDSGKTQILEVLQNISKYSMFPRSYSKFLTFYKNVYTVPMNILAGHEYLTELMEGLDGVLLTGGSSEFFVKDKIKIDSQNKSDKKEKLTRTNSKYFDTVIKILAKAKEINDKGRIFPLWGTCLGFEAMILNEAPADTQFDSFKDIKKTHSLVLTDDDGNPLPNIQTTSASFQSPNMQMSFKLGTEELNMSLINHQIKLPQSPFDMRNYDTFQDFLRTEFYGKQDQKTLYFYHHYGFTTSKFNSTPSLKENFRILSVSDENDFLAPTEDVNDITDKLIYSHPLVKNIKEMINANKTTSTFVSAVEHKKYPFYGVQFHPEKPLFDFKDNRWVRSDDLSIDDNRKFSTFFIQRLRAAKLKNIKNKKQTVKLDSIMTSLKKFQVNHVGLFSEVVFFKQAISLDLD